jgi:hypothetical protein
MIARAAPRASTRRSSRRRSSPSTACRIAILFRELPDGKVKVSLRSKGQLDVQRWPRDSAAAGTATHRDRHAGAFRQVVDAITRGACARGGRPCDVRVLYFASLKDSQARPEERSMCPTAAMSRRCGRSPETHPRLREVTIAPARRVRHGPRAWDRRSTGFRGSRSLLPSAGVSHDPPAAGPDRRRRARSPRSSATGTARLVVLWGHVRYATPAGPRALPRVRGVRARWPSAR